jgi:hypothetical protein
MSNFTVSTRDRDGTDRREYLNIDEAIARFVEVTGQSLASAINEQYEFADVIPTVQTVKYVEAISAHGTLVVFERHREVEPEAAPVATAAPDRSYEALEAQAAELREGIDSIEESAAERMGQYRSECAMFGDAGPGQHPSCWAGRSDELLAEARAELAAVLAMMEAMRPGAAQAAADAAAAALPCPF